MVKRLQDWPSRLLRLVESRQATPFAWGVQDCCSFARACVEAMTGTDPGSVFPEYSSKEMAEAIIGQTNTLEELIAERCAELGFAELAVARKAQRGDLVIFDNGGTPALGVCVGSEVAMPGKYGLVFHPLRECRRAWRVG